MIHDPFAHYRDADLRYRKAAAKSERLSVARSNLPAGTSRARVTTANARWAIAAEARDRIERELRTAWDELRKPWEMTHEEWIREMGEVGWDPSGAAGPTNHHQALHYILRKLARKLFLRAYLPNTTRRGEEPVAANWHDVMAWAREAGLVVEKREVANG